MSDGRELIFSASRLLEYFLALQFFAAETIVCVLNLCVYFCLS